MKYNTKLLLLLLPFTTYLIFRNQIQTHEKEQTGAKITRAYNYNYKYTSHKMKN